MADWTILKELEMPHGCITPASVCAGSGIMSFISAFSGSGTWQANNRAHYIPFMVTQIVTAYQMSVIVATQSGNLDVGIYTEQGVRLVSAGSTAVAAAGVQTVNINDTVLLPGVYFMAMNCDNTTAAFNRVTAPDNVTQRACGIQVQDVGAIALPDPATFGDPASGAQIPFISIGLRSTAV